MSAKMRAKESEVPLNQDIEEITPSSKSIVEKTVEWKDSV